MYVNQPNVSIDDNDFPIHVFTYLQSLLCNRRDCHDHYHHRYNQTITLIFQLLTFLPVQHFHHNEGIHFLHSQVFHIVLEM